MSHTRRSQKRLIARNTLFNGAAQATSLLATLVFLPLVIRSLGPNDYGVLVLVTSLGSWMLLVDLGIGPATARRVAEYTAQGRDREMADTIVSGTVIYSLLGAAAAAALLLLGLAGGALFRLEADQAALFRTLCAVTAAAHLVYWPSQARRDALAGLQRYDITSSILILAVVAEIVGSLYVILVDPSPVALTIARSSALMLTAVAYRVAFRVVVPARMRVRPSLTRIRDLLRTGSPIFTLQIAQLLSRQHTDRIVVGAALGPGAVTIYEVAAKLSSLISTLIGVLSSAIMPVAAKLNAQRYEGSLRMLFERGSYLIALATAPVNVVLIVIAGPFLLAWGGTAFAEATVPGQLLLAAQLLVPLYCIGDAILIGKGRFGAWVPGGLALSVLKVVLSVTLVGRFGITGVAVGAIIVAAIEIAWYMRVFAPEISLPVGHWIRTTAAPVYGLLVIPITVALGLSQTAMATSLPGLATIGVISVAAYWLIAGPLTAPGDLREIAVRAIRARRTR